MARATLLILVLVAPVLAGCLGAGDPALEPEPAGGEPEVLIDPNRRAASLGEIVTGPAVGPDLNATTQAPPRLVEGEWWRIRFLDVLGDQDVEVVRVVADVHEDGYVVGMPHEGWLKEAISYHSPAFGDVALDLSYDTHNERFEPVRFPIVEGDTWETRFALTPLTAQVIEADERTATITLTPPEAEPQPTDPLFTLLTAFEDAVMTLTYDATMHEIVRMESAIGVWEVIAHGYDYEGWVTVPRGEHTAIDYGTFGPASETHDPLPRTLEVSGGFNRMTMMHVVIPFTPGVYKVRDEAPDGTVLETDATDQPVLAFYEVADPDGTWTVQDVLGGAGATYSMGIAYHQYDIRLPDGLRRADHAHEVIR